MGIRGSLTSICVLRSFVGSAHDGARAGDVRALPTAVSLGVEHKKRCPDNQKPAGEATPHDHSPQTKKLGPPVPVGTNGIDTAAEAQVVQRLAAKLKDGPIRFYLLKAFLGDPLQGGGPKDLQVANDVEAFVDRHTDAFFYDTSTRMVGLRAHSGIDFQATAEARVVQRLKARLRHGPVDGVILKSLLPKPFSGDRPDLEVIADKEGFSSRHMDTFSYDAATKTLRLRDSAGNQSIDPQVEGQVVERLTARLQHGPITVSGLRSRLGNPVKGGGPKDLEVVADLEAFIGRHADAVCYNALTKTISLRAPTGPTTSAVGMKTAAGAGTPMEPVHIAGSSNFTRKPNPKPDPEEVRLAKSPEAPVVRPKDPFYYLKMVSKSVKPRAPADEHGIDPEAEAAVIQRLIVTLKRGPVNVDLLRTFLGDPDQGGGPEDLELVGDLPSFVEGHRNVFFYDAATNAVGLRVEAGCSQLSPSVREAFPESPHSSHAGGGRQKSRSRREGVMTRRGHML